MANLVARQADMATAIADLKALITNCGTDIAANDSDAEAIRRLKEQADSALQAFGMSGDEVSAT